MGRKYVEITGERFDLADFVHCFPNGEFYFWEDANRFYFHCVDFQAIEEPKEILERSGEMISEITSILKVIGKDVIRPEVGRVLIEDAQGKVLSSKIIGAGTIRVRAKIHARFEGSESCEELPHLFHRLTRNDRHLRNSLLLLSDEHLSWAKLYLALEELERSLGETSDAARLCSRNERERFHQTANSGEVTGLESRHAMGRVPAPKNPMPIQEATAFVRSMLRGAIERKARE